MGFFLFAIEDSTPDKTGGKTGWTKKVNRAGYFLGGTLFLLPLKILLPG